MTPSASRRAILLLPDLRVLAKASVTSSVIGMGQRKPLANFMSLQTLSYSALFMKPVRGEKAAVEKHFEVADLARG